MRRAELGPPYAPPANVALIFRAWRERGMPAVVDRAWFERIGLSGNLTTRNVHALRYLRLVDEEHRPTERAERLRTAPADGFAATLAAIVRTSYANVWAICDPAAAPRARIEDAFRHESPSAQRSRMVGCFIGLCTQAGIATAGATAVREPARHRRQRRITNDSPAAPASDPAPCVSAGNPELLALLIAKFPDFDPAWPADVRERWFAAFERLRDALLASG